MSFSQNERTLQVIQSEIKKLNQNIAKKLSKKKLKDNEFLKEVNENIIDLQKSILEEKLQQLEQINKLYEYLENHYNENKKGIIFQQKKLNKLRSKLKQEIEKYLSNI